VWVAAGSTRTADNWLDRSAAAQERLIAFGVHGVYDDGTAFQNMAPYNQVLSRAEIARVVEYIRKLDPVVVTVKSKDP
jgi:mono/diheme cytochrome c family protein